MSALYLIVNVAVLSVPLLFSWHPQLRFVDRWRDFFLACGTVAVLFVAWDVVFASRGIWGFNDAYLLGPRVAGLPIEEWLFFLCIPYACVFTYHSLDALDTRAPAGRAATTVTALALVLSVVLAVLFSDRHYTFVTCSLLTVFLSWLVWRRPSWTGRMWSTLGLLVVPFVLSNGVLTGLRFWQYPVLVTSPDIVQGQVVWYNNLHNLGVRLFSIPLDDFFYATLLIGLNVALFEFFGRRRKAASA